MGDCKRSASTRIVRKTRPWCHPGKCKKVTTIVSGGALDTVEPHITLEEVVFCNSLRFGDVTP